MRKFRHFNLSRKASLARLVVLAGIITILCVTWLRHSTSSVPHLAFQIPALSSYAAYSPDGTILVTIYSGENIIRVWDAHTGTSIRQVQNSDIIVKVTFSPDGKFLAVLSGNNSISIWDISTWQLSYQVQAEPRLFDIAYSPDGHFVAATGIQGQTNDGAVYFLNTATREIVRRFTWKVDHPVVLLPLFFNSKGDLLAVADSTDDTKSTTRIWKVADGNEYTEIALPTAVLSMAWSPKANLIAIGGRDFKLRIWDVSAMREVVQLNHDFGPINAAAYSPKGQFIATGGNHQPTTLWSTSSWQQVFDLHDINSTGMINSISYSPDGRFLAISKVDRANNTTDVWDLAPLG